MPRLLLTVLLVTFVAPFAMARHADPVRGARRLLVVLLGFNLLYVAFLVLVYAPHYAPEWFH